MNASNRMYGQSVEGYQSLLGISLVARFAREIYFSPSPLNQMIPQKQIFIEDGDINVDNSMHLNQLRHAVSLPKAPFQLRVPCSRESSSHDEIR